MTDYRALEEDDVYWASWSADHAQRQDEDDAYWASASADSSRMILAAGTREEEVTRLGGSGVPASRRHPDAPRRVTHYFMRTGPAIVEVRLASELVGAEKVVLRSRTKRQRIDHFSRQSRINFRRAALHYPWDELGRICLVTLTYPQEFPRDGKVVRKQFDALWHRFYRAFGRRARGMWVREFQMRGAPHYHVFMECPRGYEFEQYQTWGFDAWSEIVGFDPLHRMSHWQMGLRFNVSPAWYADGQATRETAAYLYRHAGKLAQKDVPEDFVNVGRFWGVLGPRPPKPEVEFCCVHSYLMVRRILRQAVERRIKGPLASQDAAMGGVWSAADGGHSMGDRLMKWAKTECACAKPKLTSEQVSEIYRGEMMMGGSGAESEAATSSD